jgi:uncharacterized protein YebE (UPF0316 family)
VLVAWFLPAGPTLPLFIFLAEACVVTLATLRTIFVARGMKVLAPALGFFEVSIWLFAIGEVMKNLSDVTCSLAFAGGFTLGNFLGVVIEQALAIGCVMVRAITSRDAAPLVQRLREAGFGVTCLEGHGASGAVQVVFTVVPRKSLGEVTTLLEGFDPTLFYSVDALQASTSGVAPAPRRFWASILPAACRLPFFAR